MITCKFMQNNLFICFSEDDLVLPGRSILFLLNSYQTIWLVNRNLSSKKIIVLFSDRISM
jgi:hypothetical protein